jgi:hypothetical protein
MDKFLTTWTKSAASINISVLALAELLKKKFVFRTPQSVIDDESIIAFVVSEIGMRYECILGSMCAEWDRSVSLDTVNEIEQLLLFDQWNEERDSTLEDEDPNRASLVIIRDKVESLLTCDVPDLFFRVDSYLKSVREMSAVVEYLNTRVVAKLHLPVVE